MLGFGAHFGAPSTITHRDLALTKEGRISGQTINPVTVDQDGSRIPEIENPRVGGSILTFRMHECAGGHGWPRGAAPGHHPLCPISQTFASFSAWIAPSPEILRSNIMNV